MREFSKVSPSVWRSQKFKRLSTIEARQVYLYLLTCPHGTSAGCFDLHPMYAAADLGISLEAYQKALDSLSEAGLIVCDGAENSLWIVNWDEFNVPTNPKHALGLLSQLEQCSSEKIKAIAFNAFLPRMRARGHDRDPSVKRVIDSLSKAFPKSISTETERETETKTETETETERETKTRARLHPAASGASAPAGQAPPLGTVSPALLAIVKKGA